MLRRATRIAKVLFITCDLQFFNFYYEINSVFVSIWNKINVWVSLDYIITSITHYSALFLSINDLFQITLFFWWICSAQITFLLMTFGHCVVSCLPKKGLVVMKIMSNSDILGWTKCYVFACKSTLTTEIGCMHTILPQNMPDCPLVHSFLALWWFVCVCVCSWLCDRLHPCMPLTEPGACCVCLQALCRGAPGPERVIWFFSIAAPQTCNLALMLMVSITMVGFSNSSGLLYSTEFTTYSRKVFSRNSLRK